MRASSIQRKLRDLNVPIEKARSAAERYGDDAGTPTDMEKLQKAIRKAARQKLVEQHRREFRAWCKGNGIPNPTHEFQFAQASHGRHWAFDWAWPDPTFGGDRSHGGAALEIEGGIYSRGRHVRPQGYRADMEKYTTAALLGWTLIRVEWATLYTDATAAAIRAAIQQQGSA